MPVAVGVPASLAVPLWLSVKVIPAGKVPEIEIVGTGYPLVVMVKLLTVDFVKVSDEALVIKGGIGAGFIIKGR